MNKLLTLILLLVLSGALFLGVFSVVHRPLVVGEIQRQLDYKLDYARTLSSPKILILAGSNGRFSHRCALLSQALHRPCVNGSIGVGIGLDFQLEQWEPMLQAGDMVYLPLEYSQYAFTAAQMHAGLQNALLVHSQQPYLWSLDWPRIAAAYGSFDLQFLVHGLVEMALDRRGFRRRSSTDSLTPQGDEQGHTLAAGAPYAAAVRAGEAEAVRVPEDSDAMRVIAQFLRRARAQGITVVGGLPTLPDSVTVDPEQVERLHRFYASSGQQLLVLAHQSRYPIECFYDSLYHLNEACQRAHSMQIGAALAASGDVDAEMRGRSP